MSNVSSATKFFSTANEGFQTTVGADVASGATTVVLTSTGGLTDGSVFVGIIEPGVAIKQQVFTGTVNVSTNSITGVVWTRGTNSIHATGSTVVDYVTGTDWNLLTTGLLKEHKQSGAHGNVTADSVATNTLTVGGSNITSLTPTGTIVMFGAAAAPSGWLLCDGSSYLRSTFSTLFGVIGSTYGSVDGTHFNVPDLRGRTAFGVDSGQTEFTPLGHTGGQKDLMAHGHGVNDGGHNHGVNDPGHAHGLNTDVAVTSGGNQRLQINGGGQAFDYRSNVVGGSGTGIWLNGSGANVSIQTSGSGANNLNPYLALNYIIKS